MHRIFRWAALLVAASFAAGCAGQSSPGIPRSTTSEIAPSAGSDTLSRATRKRARLTIRLLIPTHSRKRGRQPRGIEHQHYISASTQGVEFQVFAHGKRNTALATSLATVALGSPQCTQSNPRTCTIAAAVPAGGPEDVVVTLWSQPPSGNAPAGDKLGVGVATTTIETGAANAINVTVGGIVSEVLLTVPTTQAIKALTPFTETATVTAYDADANVIATDAFVDASGNPLTISFAADSYAGSAVTLSPASITSPTTNGIAVHYIPSDASGIQLENGFTTSLTASATGIVTASTTLTVSPVAFKGYVTSAAPTYLTLANDGSVWFTESTNGSGHLTEAGALNEYSSSFPRPFGFGTGSDGAQYAGTTNQGIWQSTSTPGTFVQYTAGLSGFSEEPAFAPGPGGVTWFADLSASAIGTITSGGTIVEYPTLTSNAEPTSLAEGADGNMWFTELGANQIGRITPSGSVKEFPIPNQNARPGSIVNGPDGALWYVENGNNRIDRITTAGIVSDEFDLPAGLSGLSQIVVGPDGAIWFVVANHIGRMTTAGSFALFTPSGQNLPGTPNPAAIVTGQNNDLWYADNGKLIVQAQ